jgi:hypothetical protein
MVNPQEPVRKLKFRMKFKLKKKRDRDRREFWFIEEQPPGEPDAAPKKQKLLQLPRAREIMIDK